MFVERRHQIRARKLELPTYLNEPTLPERVGNPVLAFRQLLESRGDLLSHVGGSPVVLLNPLIHPPDHQAPLLVHDQMPGSLEQEIVTMGTNTIWLILLTLIIGYYKGDFRTCGRTYDFARTTVGSPTARGFDQVTRVIAGLQVTSRWMRIFESVQSRMKTSSANPNSPEPSMVRFSMPEFIASLAVFLPLVALSQELETIPLVGAVTDRGATVMVWLKGESAVGLEYSTSANMAPSTRAPVAWASAADDFVIKFKLMNLEPATRYYYQVIDESNSARSRVQSFTTFPREGTDGALTIFFGSCQQARATDTGGVFTAVAGMGGDLFVHLGDWTYPDLLIPDYPRTKQSLRETWMLRLDTAYPFADRILSQMSLAYEWDDHDAFGSNSDGTAPDSAKRNVSAAYRRYMPHAPLPSETGIWHSFRAGSVEIFMIDNRTYRSPIDAAFAGNTFTPPAGHSMLAGSQFPISGSNQIDWLMNALRRSTARWKIIASPVPFNPSMGQMIPIALLLGRKDVAKRFAEECWSGYPADVDSIRSLIRDGYLRNTVIISGSAHTNMYDDGSHSLIPEFVAACLDQQNSGLYDSLKAYGLRIWTAGQTGSESTIGRIRVETAPRHRLVIESFTEGGVKMLELVVDEQPVGSIPSDASRGRGLVVTNRSGTLVFQSEFDAGMATIRLFTIDGRQAASSTILIDARGAAQWTLPDNLPAGTYVGRIEKKGIAAPFAVAQ